MILNHRIQDKAEPEISKYMTADIAEWESLQTFDKNSSRKLEMVFHHRVIGAVNA